MLARHRDWFTTDKAIASFMNNWIANYEISDMLHDVREGTTLSTRFGLEPKNCGCLSSSGSSSSAATDAAALSSLLSVSKNRDRPPTIFAPRASRGGGEEVTEEEKQHPVACCVGANNDEAWRRLFFFRAKQLRAKGTQEAEGWEQAYYFWTKVFALTFALGVVSGITMSFQFGTNWPGFMEKAGNIAGPLLG